MHCLRDGYDIHSFQSFFENNSNVAQIFWMKSVILQSYILVTYLGSKKEVLDGHCNFQITLVVMTTAKNVTKDVNITAILKQCRQKSDVFRMSLI